MSAPRARIMGISAVQTGQVSARSALFGPASTLPFLPMRWVDLDRPPQFNVHPRIANATTGKNEGMDRPATVNNGKPYIVVCGNICGAIELVPHANPREH